ncbi:Tripeptidyl-peptidase [Podosphaera aphanis]|nr:Tripeptidyl-peptidase [Podosphaera aphanis]
MRSAIVVAALFTAATCLTTSDTERRREQLLFNDDYQIFEKLSSIPHPWVLKDSGDVNPNQSFKLRIHLKNLNSAAFKQKVLDLSTPNHPTYGQHMSREEVQSFLAPPVESFQLVTDWLELERAGNATIENDWFVLDSTIGQVERLLRTRYQLFENSETGEITARTLEYSLPRSLHTYVDIIAPTIKLSTPKTHRSTIVDWPSDQAEISTFDSSKKLESGISAACNTSIIPDCLSDLYNIREINGSSTNGNQLGIAGFLEQYAQQDDLDKFFAKYLPKATGSTFSTQLVNGGLNTQQNVSNTPIAMEEANLDIQYTFQAYPIPQTYISTGGRPPENSNVELDNEPYLQFLTFLLASPQVPQTLSVSYGDDEYTVPQTLSVSYGDDEYTVPRSYALTVCDLFSQLAARGVSVIVSSGDSGSGKNCSAPEPGKLKYSPGFPASCPFVTAVGATLHIEPEMAVGFSGGGFSNYFDRPAYQEDTVGKYLSIADPTFKQFYNQSGRGIPDVSVQGVNYHVFVRGVDVMESGTSASAPTFAAIISLLNSDRIDRGLTPYGFLNPFLYSQANATFTDIVEGKGSGCPQVPGSGFSAVGGWDAVTGLGTPDMKKLRQLNAGDVVIPEKRSSRR